MKASKFYIQELELEHDPDPSELGLGQVEVEFEVLGPPTYDEETGRLHSEFALDISLSAFPMEGEESEEPEDRGRIEVDLLNSIEGDEEEFEEHVETWEEEGYDSVDFSFRYHLESALMSDVISPISGLIKDSFRGVLPHMTLSSPPESQSEFTIGGDIDPADVDEEVLRDAIRETIADMADEDVDVSIGSPDDLAEEQETDSEDAD